MAQSTNDTVPTAMRIATLFLIRETLPAMDHLAQAFEAKGREFDHILKSGRTHLQDATPIRLGQEFAAYGLTVWQKRPEGWRIVAVHESTAGR